MASAPASCGARDRRRRHGAVRPRRVVRPSLGLSPRPASRLPTPAGRGSAATRWYRAPAQAGPCAARRYQPAVGPGPCPCRRCPVPAAAPPAPGRLPGRHSRSPRGRRMICRGGLGHLGNRRESSAAARPTSSPPAFQRSTRCQPCSTSPACSAGNKRAPAKISGNRSRSNSSAVTTPKLPPPPRTAQNRSGSFFASTRICSPPAVTSSIAVTRLQARPCLRT